MARGKAKRIADPVTSLEGDYVAVRLKTTRDGTTEETIDCKFGRRKDGWFYARADGPDFQVRVRSVKGDVTNIAFLESIGQLGWELKYGKRKSKS